MQSDPELHSFLSKVDGSYPARHKDLQPIITWKSSNTPVSKEFRLPIPVEHTGSIVDYSFQTLDNDIQFAVVFSTEKDEENGRGSGEESGDVGEEEVVIAQQRFASHLDQVTGTFHLSRPGRLTLVWNNGYSWFKHKVLSYSVTLHVPSLLATERAKCERAVQALRTCIGDRDGARERGHEASTDLAEVEEEVQALQEEMKVLQARLEKESQLAASLSREAAEMSSRVTLETLKIRGLTFRILSTPLLELTLSFASEKDEWWWVCKDWKDAMQVQQTPATTPPTEEDEEANS